MKRLIHKAIVSDEKIIENLPEDLKKRIKEIDQAIKEYEMKRQVSTSEKDAYHKLVKERASILSQGLNNTINKFVDDAKDAVDERDEDGLTISEQINILLQLRNTPNPDAEMKALLPRGVQELKDAIIEVMMYTFSNNRMLRNFKTKEKMIDLLIEEMGINKWQYQKLVEIPEFKNLIEGVIYKEFPQVAPKKSQLTSQDRTTLSHFTFVLGDFLKNEDLNKYYKGFRSAISAFKKDPVDTKYANMAGDASIVLEAAREDWRHITDSNEYKTAVKHGFMETDLIGKYLDTAHWKIQLIGYMHTQDYTPDELVQNVVDAWNFVVPGHKETLKHIEDLVKKINEYIEKNK